MAASDKDFVIVLLNVLIFVHIGIWIYPVISRSTFSHLLMKYLLNTYYVPSTVLNPAPPPNMAVNKTKMLDLKELIF